MNESTIIEQTNKPMNIFSWKWSHYHILMIYWLGSKCRFVITEQSSLILHSTDITQLSTLILHSTIVLPSKIYLFHNLITIPTVRTNEHHAFKSQVTQSSNQVNCSVPQALPEVCKAYIKLIQTKHERLMVLP